MIFFTSISPKHIVENRQQECVKSWLVHGEVISLNHPEEIEVLKTQGYDECIQFVPTYRTQKPFFGKHYVCVNAITDYIREHKVEDACMINSDIEIIPDKEVIKYLLKKSKTEFVYLHRCDFNDDKKAYSTYMDGVDAFFLTPELCDTLPQTMYCLGHCYFDIWLPWHFLVQKQMMLTTVNSKPVIYHQRHTAQYNHGDWHTMGKITGFITGMSYLHPSEVSAKIYNTIRKHTQYI